MRIEGAHAEYQRRTARFHLVEGELKPGNQISISYGTLLITDMLTARRKKASKDGKAGTADKAAEAGKDGNAAQPGQGDAKPKPQRPKKLKTIEEINDKISKAHANIAELTKLPASDDESTKAKRNKLSAAKGALTKLLKEHSELTTVGAPHAHVDSATNQHIEDAEQKSTPPHIEENGIQNDEGNEHSDGEDGESGSDTDDDEESVNGAGDGHKFGVPEKYVRFWIYTGISNDQDTKNDIFNYAVEDGIVEGPRHSAVPDNADQTGSIEADKQKPAYQDRSYDIQKMVKSTSSNVTSTVLCNALESSTQFGANQQAHASFSNFKDGQGVASFLANSNEVATDTETYILWYDQKGTDARKPDQQPSTLNTGGKQPKPPKPSKISDWLSEKHTGSSTTPKYLPSVLLEREVTDAMVDLCARLSNGKVEYETAVRCISTIMMKKRSYTAVNDEGVETRAEYPVVFLELALQQPKKDKADKPDGELNNEGEPAAMGADGDKTKMSQTFGAAKTKTKKTPINKEELHRVFEEIRMCYNDTKSASDIALALYATGDSRGMFDLTIADLRDEALKWDSAGELTEGTAKRVNGKVQLTDRRYMHARLSDAYLMYITTSVSDTKKGTLTLIDLKNKRDKFDLDDVDNRMFKPVETLKRGVDALGVGITQLDVLKDGRKAGEKKTDTETGRPFTDPFYIRKDTARYNQNQNANNEPIGILSFDKDKSGLKRALRIVLHGTDDDTDGFALSAHDRLTNETARSAMELHEMQVYIRDNNVNSWVVRFPTSSLDSIEEAVELEYYAAQELAKLSKEEAKNTNIPRSVLTFALPSGVRSRMSMFAKDAIEEDALKKARYVVENAFGGEEFKNKTNHKVHTYREYTRNVNDTIKFDKAKAKAMHLLAKSRCSFSGVPMEKLNFTLTDNISDAELARIAVSLSPMEYLTVNHGAAQQILATINKNRLRFPITREVLCMHAADSLDFLLMVASYIEGDPSGFRVREAERMTERAQNRGETAISCVYDKYNSADAEQSIMAFVRKTNECLMRIWHERAKPAVKSTALPAAPPGGFGKARSMRRFV